MTGLGNPSVVVDEDDVDAAQVPPLLTGDGGSAGSDVELAYEGCCVVRLLVVEVVRDEVDLVEHHTS